MKKVILGIILLSIVTLFTFSFIKLDSIKSNTKHLENEISNIEKKTKKAKDELTKNTESLTVEKDNSNSIIGELEIWEKAKEKLKKAQ